MRRTIRKLLTSTPYLWRFKDKFDPLFPGSLAYWEDRYRAGGTSGAGSYGQLAHFKAEFLNTFVRDNALSSVIEFGCGDGAQLELAAYEKYIGLDISKKAIQLCVTRFREDKSKSFFTYDGTCFADNAGLFRAELSISLDVIQHLVEDQIFHTYVEHLFEAATRYVVIYSSDFDKKIPNSHVRHRHVSKYIRETFPEWHSLIREKQKYSVEIFGDEQGSFSEFFVYIKR